MEPFFAQNWESDFVNDRPQCKVKTTTTTHVPLTEMIHGP